MLRCPHCGKENPAEYRFCGMCGKPVSPPASTPPTVNGVKAPVERREQEENVPLTGPSFLGLGHSSDQVGYLLEDEESSSSGHGRMYLALVLLLLAGGLLGWKWHFGTFPWQTRMSVPTAATSAPQPSDASNTTGPAQSGAQPPAMSANSGQAENPSPAGEELPQQSSDSQSNQTEQNTAAESANHPAESAPAANDNQPEKSTPPTKQNEASNLSAEPAKSTSVLKKAPVVSKPSRAKQAVADQADSSASEAEALLVQGERYLYGNGVTQNCGRAQSSLEAAADHNSTKAFSDLGTMYSTGQCVKRDLPTAYRWFAKALHQQPENTRIATDLQVLWNQMTPQEKQAAMRAE